MARTTKTAETLSPPLVPLKQTTGRLTVFVLIILLFCAIGIAGYFYYQYKHIASPMSDTAELSRLIEEIGVVMELPSGETPTLATVTDQEKLADQPFFQKAQNGDKVLIYTNNGRAILYRPGVKKGEKGKIIDVTTINVNTPSTSPETPASSSSTTPPPITPSVSEETPKIALYNGTTKKALTQKYESEIMKEYTSATIVAKESASKPDYEQTMVVDLTGKQTDLAKKLATTYGVTVTPLPTGETAPDADILVIYGADRL